MAKRKTGYADATLTKEGTLIVGPENDAGKRIGSVWLFVSVDENGDEGVCAFMGSTGWMPMVASDEQRRDLLIPIAREIAQARGIKVVMRRFSVGEDEQVFKP